MTYPRLLCTVAALFFCTHVIANVVQSSSLKKPWAWVASINTGPVWASGGETQTFFLTPGVEKTYAAKKSADALPSGELFFGVQKSLNARWLGQLGVALATTGDGELEGEIWDDANVRFNNYAYQYTVRNTRFALKGKLLFDKDRWFLVPWLSLSLGVGFNRAHDFTNTPLIFEALANPNFGGHTQTAFTYTLGAGVQRSIDKHWGVGISYEFADWGKSQLSTASDQTTTSRLTLNHLYTNGVLFNLTYVA